MVACLHLFTGADRHLAEGESHTFGRADCGKELENVSRQQFRLECHAGQVRVTNLSKVNPTKILLAADAGGVLLAEGEDRVLAPGDRVLLLACDPSMWVGLTSVGQASADGGGGGAAEGQGGGLDGGLGERPSKRAKGQAEGGADGQQQQPQQQQQQQQQQQPQQQPRAGQPGDDQQQTRQQLEQAAGQGGSSQPEQGPQQQQARQPGAAAGAAPPVMLVLVGVQGAGKSFFCQNLMQRRQQAEQAAQQAQQQWQGPRWVRVNQDSIAGAGRKGTREQCIEAARAALQRGDSVLVDRTHVVQDQRLPFVRLAQELGAQAHCLVLKLPKKVCMDRAAARAGHEGGLQGKAVYPAINRMYTDFTEAGDPDPREGFASVLICGSDAEVEAALQAWSVFGPERPDPAAEYAKLKPPPPKAPALNTLDRFFQRKPTAVGEGEAAAGPQQAQQAQRAKPPAPAQSQEQPTGLAKPAQQQQQQQQGAQSPQQQQPAGGPSREAAVPRSGTPTNAFQAMMVASRKQAKEHASPASPAARGAAAAAAGEQGAGGGGSGGRHTFGAGPYAGALAKIAEDPESCRAEQPELWFDEQCVLIADKFPKARQHWLVVSRDRRLEGPLSLSAADIRVVEHMLAVARRKAGRLRDSDPALRFRYGFHAAPSLRQLHMHVISQDFDSPGLKNKRHWHTFTHSGFFLDAEPVLAQLRAAGALQYSPEAAEAFLKEELRCHRCRAAVPNMPKLKAHIAQCTGPLPAAAE